jgi:hypothetical protein
MHCISYYNPYSERSYQGSYYGETYIGAPQRNEIKSHKCQKYY